jgi:hypothetical protein
MECSERSAGERHAEASRTTATAARRLTAAAVILRVVRVDLHLCASRRRRNQPGQMLYFYPLGTGVTKREAGINPGMNGWSHPSQYFSCCMGTGIEAHAKLQSEVFFHSLHEPSAEGGRTTSELWVVSFVSAELTWHEQGVVVTLAFSVRANTRFQLCLPTVRKAPCTFRAHCFAGGRPRSARLSAVRVRRARVT